MVTWQICTTTDASQLKNAFASWPSGHSSTSWSGLLYLTLFFCAKFGVKLPALRTPSRDLPNRGVPLRNQGAAPPAYLVLLASVPVGAAFFISISRWFDYRHHGLDIFSGAVLGIICAWISFRLYQEPISAGDGWAWSARSRSSAFGLLAGRPSYTDDVSWDDPKMVSMSERSADVESRARLQDDSYEMQRGQQTYDHDRTSR
jgi:hypothetical protein